MRLIAVLAAGTLLAACEVTVDTDGEDGQAENSANMAQPAPQPNPAAQQQAQPIDPALRDLRFMVDISDRKLRLFNGDRMIGEHDVAVGTQEWPTPTGSWDIHRVDINPEWIPPKSEEWAKDEERAAPGAPDNPMGRARLVYRMPNTIHGTDDLQSLGKASSHGSIRVANEVVVPLAQMLLRAGGAWQGDQWFQQMVQNRGKEHQIELSDPVPIQVQD